MYRVFLIDDEAWALISLERLICWEDLGYTIAGKAGSAREAWEAIVKDPPDVIITDIRMPGMSGLELLERLRSCGMKTQVILVSGFAEFRYAQEAVHHGAFEYLLKQISREQLTDCLLRLAKVLASDSAPANRRGPAHDSSEDDLLSMRKLRASDAARIALSYNGWDAPGMDHFFVGACRDVGDQDAYTKTAVNWRDCAVFPIGTEDGAAFVLCGSDRDEAQAGPLRRKISALNASDREIFSVWGFSRVALGNEPVSRQMREARTALNSACFAGKTDQVYHGKEGRWGGFEELARAVRYRQNFLVQRQIKSLQESVRRGDVLTDELYVICGQMDYEYRQANEGRPLLPDGWTSDADLLRQFPEEEYFFSWLISCFSVQEENQVSEQVLLMMEENLKSGLTLAAVGRELGMSQSALSQILKKKSGKTYSELFQEIRMKKARELLTYTELSMVEIADETGFSDQFYFSKIFKKVHGISPNEYRKARAQVRQ